MFLSNSVGCIVETLWHVNEERSQDDELCQGYARNATRHMQSTEIM